MDSAESPLADTEVHHFGRWKVFVGHCGPSPRHVLCLVDGNGYFGATVDIVRLMQQRGLVPPMLVVGIGYPVGPVGETIVQRTFDLSPTSDPAYAALFADPPEMGGAPALVDFITDTLLPWVDSQFGTAGAERCFYGHSLGGLFATWAMFERPDAFGRWILASPSYWWHGGAIFDAEERYAAAHDDLPVRVYMAIGAEETNEGRQRESSLLPPEERALTGRWVLEMVDDMQRMVDRLRGRQYPGLRLDTDVLPDEFHVTVPFVVLTRGLRRLYDAP